MRGYGLILVAAVLFGTTGTARALGAEAIAPWLTGAFRLLIGGPLLLLFCLVFRPAAPSSSGPTLPWRALLGASLGVVLFQFTFFEAVHRTGVAAGTLVSIGSAPIFAGILGGLCFKESLDRTWGLATVMAIAGCALLVLPGQAVAVDLSGLAMAMAAGAGYAVYVGAGRSLARIMAPAKAVGLVLTLGGLLMLPWLCLADLSGLALPRVGLTLAYLGIFPTAVSYFFLTAGLAQVPVSRASILLLVEPMVGSLLGICLLGEPFTLWSGMGMALIFSGMVVVAVKPQQPAPAGFDPEP